MSKRLQVTLEDREMREIQRIAQRSRMTVANWVRQTLRAARRQEPGTEARVKLEILRAAAQNSFPTGDSQQILAEIERGYLPETPK